MFNQGYGNGYSLADIAAATGGNYNNGAWGDQSWWIIILFLFCMNGDFWGNRNGMGGGAGSPAFQGTTTREEISYGFDMNDLQSGIRGISQGLADGFYAMNTGMLNGFSGVNNAVCDLGYTMQQGFNTGNVALMSAQNALSTQLADCCCGTKSAIQQAAFENLQGQNAITREISDCCCETSRQIERGFADINYNMATNICGLQTSLANATRDIIDGQNASTRAILDYLCQEKISDLKDENQALRLAASQQAQNNYLVSQLGPKAPIPSYTVANPYCNCNSQCLNY